MFPLSKYVWSGDTQLQDVDDYYARKKYICRCCGKRKELCEENPCSNPDYEMQDEDYEELTEDIILPDYAYEDVMTPTGAVIKQKVQKKIPAFSPVYKDGEPVMEEADEPVLDDTGPQPGRYSRRCARSCARRPHRPNCHTISQSACR